MFKNQNQKIQFSYLNLVQIHKTENFQQRLVVLLTKMYYISVLLNTSKVCLKQ